ncbi:hypothetical protein JW766_00935 [Candidatus Dojkabacteria bacterium]|nr:hypothetical protein [Candidatus Dojkabacteria bacterium]
MADNSGFKAVPKEQAVKEDTSVVRPKTRRGSKLKLWACILILILGTLCVCLGTIGILWAGGWLEDYVCSTVLEDSYVWEKLNCGKEEKKEPPIADEKKDEKLPEKEQTPEKKEFFEYVWYEDEYIKFQYPKGWTVETKDDKDPISYIGSDLQGVQQISIENSDMSLMITIPAGHGADEYIYDFSKPLELSVEYDVGETEGGPKTIKLKNKPLMYDLEEYDITLLGILEKFSAIGEDPHTLFIVGKKEGDTFTSYGFVMTEFDFLAYDEEGGDNPHELMVNCSLEDKVDFDKCSEFVNQFFVSVEKK